MWQIIYRLADASRLRPVELRQDLALLLGQELEIERLSDKVVIRGETAQPPRALEDSAPRSAVHLLLHLNGVEISWPAKGREARRPKVVLQCATDTEYEQLEVALQQSPIDARRSDSGASGPFTCWETEFSTIIAVRPFFMGVVDSALMTFRMINEFKPDALCMIGIAAGLNSEKQRFGDLLVAASSHDLFYGKWEGSGRGGINLRTDQRQCTARVDEELLLKLASPSETQEIRESVFRQVPGSRPVDRAPNIEVGAMACVPSVIDSKPLLEQLLRTNVAPRKCIGLEMEIFGTYRAGQLCKDWRGRCIAIKAISDFAYEKDDRSEREYAAYVSAAFVLALLRDQWLP